MSEKKVSDFVVLDKIADQCGDNGIAMFPTIIKGNVTKMGGEITIGVPGKSMDWFLRQSHHFVLYAINKDDFQRIKSELEQDDTTENPQH